ncbi:TolB family protein [Streptomyces werraensis]|uniref:TolB family protein n=1 Tax=Streptomyces werraensis TaxID=68284 RepID=UPI001CE2A90B
MSDVMLSLSTRARLAVVALATLLFGGAAVGYMTHVTPTKATTTGVAQPGNHGQGPSGAADKRLMVLSNGLLSSVARQNPSGPREVGSQRCERQYAAADTVACLTPTGSLKGPKLLVFDRRLRQRQSVQLSGIPNRLRVSASGRMVSWTVFVGGDSYAGGSFSTRTGILDTMGGLQLMTLESFAITREDHPYRAADVNFWGVTFATDDNRFYATMATDGRRYLVEGDLAARTVRTLAENVECPSLSPDGTRIAFKQAVDGDPAKGWRPAVLDLSTLRVTRLAEDRNMDDQAIWLDHHTIAYALQRSDGINDVWALPVDGSGDAKLLVPDANSPALLD